MVFPRSLKQGLATGLLRICNRLRKGRTDWLHFCSHQPCAVNHSPLLAAAGTLIVFDGLLVHGSGPNTTDRPRRVANMVAIVPTADGTFRKFDDTLNPYLRGAPA